MVQVINDEIKKIGLPKTGTLSTGETVSGYDLLGADILKVEGWLPLEDIAPIYNSETERAVADGFEILSDKVIKKYKVVPYAKAPTMEDRMTAIENLELERLFGGTIV